MTAPDADRRPLATRQAGWARRLAAALARSAITPDQISLLSVFFAAAGAALLAWWPTWLGLLDAAVCVQLRLACNLLDGMVAVEGGKASAVGKIWNELPDRLADVVLLVALGFACGAPWLGWLGAVLAVATAYVRAFGGSLGLAQDFRGPLAKPQRMAVLTAACVIASGCALAGRGEAVTWTLWLAAVVIAAGSALTCILRTAAIARALRQVG
ncbi:MAG: CDP-alcohol phosphatidyltransferase family protein [Proteobacteria bacterium]|nr:CDP-alcohol phosphatidyltransferase family protein [Pseudomonadota bacterium]